MRRLRLSFAIGVPFAAWILTACLGDPVSLDVDQTGTGGSAGSAFDAGSDTTLDVRDAGEAESEVADVDSEAVEADSGCAHDCLGGACLLGKCQPVLIAPWSNDNQLPTGIAVDPAPAGGVYFTTYLGASVKRAEKDGSGVTVVSSFEWMHRSVDVKLDAQRLYVTTYNDQGPSPVYSMNVDGSGRFELGGTPWFWGPWLLSYDASYVYWADRFDSAFIVRAPKAGGPSEIVYQPLPPPPDPSTASDGGWVVCVDGATLFWGAGKKISRRSASGEVTDLTLDASADMAVDATYVYWTNLAKLRRIKKDGTGSVEDLASGAMIGRFALDGDYVYWTDFGHPPATDGTLNRTKLDGAKTTELLASGLYGPASIAFDATAVYYVEQQGGTVSKLAK